MLSNARLVTAICLLLTGLCITAQSQELAAQPTTPKLIRCTPASVTPGVSIELDGYRFDAFGSKQVKVLFVQGENTYSGEPTGGSRGDFRYPGLEHLILAVPEGLNPGECQIIIEVDGVASAPLTIEIATSVSPAVIGNLKPSVAQPGQLIWIDAVGISESDKVEIIDSNGRTHYVDSYSRSSGLVAAFILPEDLPGGEITFRVVEKRSGFDQHSNSLSLRIDTDPAPLAIGNLKPLAPGQWLDASVQNYVAVKRAERIEVAFIQGDQVIVPVKRPEIPRLHLQVPTSLFPGQVQIMTRTWLKGRASSWSEPVELELLDHPAAPYLSIIGLRKFDKPNESLEQIFLESPTADLITARSGDTLILDGAFLVESAGRLQVSLEGEGQTFKLKPSETGDPTEVTLTIPRELPPGQWQVSVSIIDTGASVKVPIIVRIE